jgi:ABC-type proline/glycine betaine transport system substrate-binding protein
MVMQRTATAAAAAATAAAAAAAAAASRACVNPAYEGVAPRRRVNMHVRRARATRVRLHAYT